jgi:hypothetical protein
MIASDDDNGAEGCSGETTIEASVEGMDEAGADEGRCGVVLQATNNRQAIPNEQQPPLSAANRQSRDGAGGLRCLVFTSRQ